MIIKRFETKQERILLYKKLLSLYENSIQTGIPAYGMCIELGDLTHSGGFTECPWTFFSDLCEYFPELEAVDSLFTIEFDSKKAVEMRILELQKLLKREEHGQTKPKEFV